MGSAWFLHPYPAGRYGFAPQGQCDVCRVCMDRYPRYVFCYPTFMLTNHSNTMLMQAFHHILHLSISRSHVHIPIHEPHLQTSVLRFFPLQSRFIIHGFGLSFGSLLADASLLLQPIVQSLGQTLPDQDNCVAWTAISLYMLIELVCTVCEACMDVGSSTFISYPYIHE